MSTGVPHPPEAGSAPTGVPRAPAAGPASPAAGPASPAAGAVPRTPAAGRAPAHDGPAPGDPPHGWLATLRREPRWLAGLAVAVVFAAICAYLAQWQLDRRLERAERNAAVLGNYDAEPAALDEAVGDVAGGTALPPEREWTRVALSGRYHPEDTLLVRNRPLDGANGYLVAVPFTTDRGTAVLLVRGWVPAGQDASAPDAVPAPPPGTVEVVARLRPPEPATAREARAGQTHRLDPGTLEGALADVADQAVASAYGVVADETPAPATAVTGLPRPETDPGPHLAYGVQWYLFAAAGFGIWLVLFRRHALDPDVARRERSSGAWTYDPGRGVPR